MRLAPPLILLPLLAACSGEAEPRELVPERDPMTMQALNHPIMTDPDLAGMNEANAALTGGFDQSFPPIVNTPDAIADARLEAADIVGGSSRLAKTELAFQPGDPLPEAARYAVVELARATLGPGTCLDGARYTAAWAAKMPDAAPVYPRANVTEAVGNDDAGCSLRAIRYLTPVPSEDVFAFHAALARARNMPFRLTQAGATKQMVGGRGERRFAVTAWQRASGITEIGLITSGF